MLTEKQIRQKIIDYCVLQDGSDLRDARRLENRILGLCEALGGNYEMGLCKELLESIGIDVFTVNPKWKLKIKWDI